MRSPLDKTLSGASMAATPKAVILTAPSGTGKTSLARRLQQSIPALGFSVSACTRPKRPEEIHGQHYYFLSKAEFQAKHAQGEFLESEEVYPGCFYGTLHSEIKRLRDAQRYPLFDMDVHGALRLKKTLGTRALALFITPPDLKTLEKRLRHRQTETEESIQMRLQRVEAELLAKDQFDDMVENNTFEESLARLIHKVQTFLAS